MKLTALLAAALSLTSLAAHAAGQAVGSRCTSTDPNKVCLAMHFVTYKDSKGAPLVSTDQAATIIQTMNQLWGQCNIGFQIDDYEVVDQKALGLPDDDGSQGQLDVVRRTFQSPANELVAVTVNEWSGVTNAWTNMPGDGIYGAVMESSIINYGKGIIYAHEFGHYLGLDHVSDDSELMNAVIGTDSIKITAEECNSARATANKDWVAMLRK